jgi:hypothetical protein
MNVRFDGHFQGIFIFSLVTWAPMEYLDINYIFPSWSEGLGEKQGIYLFSFQKVLPVTGFIFIFAQVGRWLLHLCFVFPVTLWWLS